ncbi:MULTISPECIES: nitroreductase family protein [Modicisalibacter]|uniref:Putative NAD(P)H nitroreductase n=1 Tax=Modicisalibacter tunisiensis TaxID=390637 RepID=A0ABS7X0Q3_9GAMM|nr:MULTISPECIES: nitroreductase family protein [Modicisalibacter]MBZ9538574.1 nitroreductase family protein [Modicisalibacter tunisiensis]MBZ9568013.1 nitroreductase family protein [Modicisalibacter tunisiensis]
MDALTLLHQRSSIGKLAGPAPSREQLDGLYRAALRAPDHKGLTPWRFIEFSGAGIDRLGELFAEAEYQANPHIDDATLDAVRKKPKRAPLIIAVIAKVTPDQPKVPPVEQVLSAGCAAHAILLAAQAMGLGAMWRTGSFAFDRTVRRGLGLGEHDELVGFLYLGQPGGRLPTPPRRDPADFVERWD